jgi:predicted transcriptional regulator of viral defense system
MNFENLLALVGDEPLFESAFLLAGEADPAAVRLQLTRWTNTGRIIQLRRGLYALAAPYQKVKPHPFLIANRLVRASYVSGQSALAFTGLIPENVIVTTSVTTGRPGRWQTPLGNFDYRHVRPDLLNGYRMTDLGDGQQAQVASPEKALLDWVYLQPGGDSPAFLQEMRLQNLDRLDLDELHRLVVRFDSPKMRRAADEIIRLAQVESREYESL